MKRTTLITVGCAMIFFLSSIAYSSGPYVSGNLGLAMVGDSDFTDSTTPGLTVEIESDTGLALGVAAGYDFGNNIRAEGEIAYQKNDLDKGRLLGTRFGLTGDISNLALLLNGYYDFANMSAFTPFISAGLGVAKVEINDFHVVASGLSNINENDSVFAYQIGAGVGYAVNEEITIDCKYRYYGTSDPEFDTTTIEYSSHNFYAGIRVTF